MSYIRTLANGKYRAEVSKYYTSIQSKTFSTQNNIYWRLIVGRATRSARIFSQMPKMFCFFAICFIVKLCH